MEENINNVLSIKTILAILCADIDIKLLMEKDQLTTKKKTHTPRQIRDQMKKSLDLLCNILEDSGYDVYKQINASFVVIPNIKNN